jgi:hypothetical protein
MTERARCLASARDGLWTTQLNAQKRNYDFRLTVELSTQQADAGGWRSRRRTSARCRRRFLSRSWGRTSIDGTSHQLGAGLLSEAGADDAMMHWFAFVKIIAG